MKKAVIRLSVLLLVFHFRLCLKTKHNRKRPVRFHMGWRSAGFA